MFSTELISRPSELEKAKEKMKNNLEKDPKKKKNATPFEQMDLEPELSSDDEPLGLCIMDDFEVDNARMYLLLSSILQALLFFEVSCMNYFKLVTYFFLHAAKPYNLRGK